jgi:hypothetical protein
MSDSTEESQKPKLSKFRPHGLALQLYISFDVRFPSDGLMRTSPD